MKQKQNTIQKILSKEMDRKQFLAFVGSAAVAISGIPTAMKFLSEEPKVRRVSTGTNFGGGPYGGTPSF